LSSGAELEGAEPTLEALSALTDDVQAAVDGGDWGRAAELEAGRRRLLARYVAAEKASRGDLEHLRGALDALQRRNNVLIGVVHHRHRLLIFDACDLKKGLRAVRAYTRSSV
jgi:hypothetical protein